MALTVGQLIDKLNQCDKNNEIQVWISDTGESYPIAMVDTEEKPEQVVLLDIDLEPDKKARS